MADPLYQAITGKFRQQLDGDAFERCALDLLRDSHYRGLRPIPRKRDAGMDGVAGPDAAPDFVLVATTAKDYRRNLRESVQRYLGAGGAARAFVLATTQEVTGERRLRLIRDAGEKWDVELHAIHDRGEFERLLYQSPEWRKKLLGVNRSALALSRFPVGKRAPVPLPLIGRDAEIARLRRADGDIVLTGKPGVGKTFLLERLASDDQCVFDLGWSIRGLKDAVIKTDPLRVVIDDVHLSPDRLDHVLQLRRDMDASFRIVAVSWPGRAGEVAARLPDAERMDIEELERDRIVEIIEAAGVAEPANLQRLIADQARGRAGLAVALAQTCKRGRVREVATGEALLGDLAAWYRRTLGEESHQALGAFALAGDAGATPKQISEITGLSPVKTSNLVRGLAEGGLLDEAERPLSLDEIFRKPQTTPPPRPNWFCVQPEALRYALVADVFCGGYEWMTAVDAAERLDPPSIAAIPLIGAAHRGANVDRRSLRSLVDWTDERAAVGYAKLGAVETRTALDAAPAHRTRIAEAAYVYGTEPTLALQVLMQQAAADERTERGDPLRVVGDYLASRGMAERRLAVETAGAWIAGGGDARAGYRVLMHAVQLKWRNASLDPGLGTTVEISEGVAPLTLIGDLGDLWDSILDITERQIKLPRDVLDALHHWVLPQSLNSLALTLDKETIDAIRGVGARVTERLAGIFRESPAVLYRLRELSERSGIGILIDVPDWFASLFPDWRNYAEHFASEDYKRSVEQIRGRPVSDIADKLMLIDREAIEAGIERPDESMPRGARRLVRELAVRDERPEEMLAALERREADSGLLGPFLDRCAELRRPGWEEAIGRLLGGDATSGAAVRVALTRPADEALKRLAIRQAAPRPAPIRELVARDEIDDATLRLLFDAPDPAIARTVALELGVSDNERLASLPPEMRARWREIVVGCPVPGYGGFVEWALGEIMGQDDAICADWVRSWFGRRRNDGGRYEDTTGVRAAIGNLPAEVRTALIADVPCGVPEFSLQPIVQCLVEGNIAAAAALFGRPECGKLRRLALKGDIGEEWMERALLALKHGWTPESVVAERHLGSIEGPYSSESRYWQQQIEAFERLRPSPEQPDAGSRERIVEAGIARYEAERADAAGRERRERVYGQR